MIKTGIAYDFCVGVVASKDSVIREYVHITDSLELVGVNANLISKANRELAGKEAARGDKLEEDIKVIKKRNKITLGIVSGLFISLLILTR